MNLRELLVTSSIKTAILPVLVVTLTSLVIGTVLLTSASVFFYLVTVLFFLIATILIWIELKQQKTFLLLLTAGMLIFFLCKPAIQATDFWGDEIGVIKIAQGSFAGIASKAIQDHVVVPPLDYQNLHWWLLATQNVPIAEREFFWRIPYMLMHVMTAIFFALTVVTQLNLTQKEERLFTVLSFFVYLTNPLFFIYGFEIRFYAFSLLSLMVLIYGTANNRMNSIWWIIIAVVSSLNSATFPIFLLFFAGILLTTRRFSNKNDLWLVLSLSQIVILSVFSKTLLMPNTGVSFMWQWFYSPVQQLLESNQVLALLLPTALVCLYRKRQSVRKNFPFSTVTTSISSIAFMIAILSSFIIKPHPDIGLRHFMLGLPGLLLLVYQVLIWSNKKFAMMALMLVIILQTYQLYTNFHQLTLISKDFHQFKNAMLLAQSKNIPVTLLVSNTFDTSLRDFFDFTLGWYAENYQVTHSLVTLDQQNCSEMSRLKNTAVFIKQANETSPCEEGQPQFLLEY